MKSNQTHTHDKVNMKIDMAQELFICARIPDSGLTLITTISHRYDLEDRG